MPLKAPESYELDHPDEPLMHKDSYEDESDLSDIDEFDPLKSGRRRYTDDASQPIRSVFDSEKNASFTRQPLAWLDGQRKRGGLSRWLIPSRFCCVLIVLFVATLVLLLSAGGIWVYKSKPTDGESEPWYPTPRGGTLKSWDEAYRRAAQLVNQMTLVEKVNITTGVGWKMGLCVGNTGPVDRLGFPSLCLQDGPLGIRFADNATAWPAGITVGATWNKELMYERGKGHGFEAKRKGVNVILGPSMGALGRCPAGGRNWEGFGTDPVLQGVAAAQTIKGIQDAGVIATAKHFIGNEQEHFRQSWEWGTPNAISANIDDRTLHEIYAWPFAEAVKAGVGSVMCSYNQVNNSYACQNSKLMNGILKDELGFQGFLQSDWLGQRSGVAAALAGLDMSMPGDGLKWADGQSLWGTELTKAVLNESVPIDRLNDMVTRVVAAWYQLGQDDKKEWPSVEDGGGPNFSSWTDDQVGNLHPGSPDSKDTGIVNKFIPVRKTDEGGDHDALARQIAAEGIVLVKNEDRLLPLSRNGSSISESRSGKLKIGIFGEDAFPNPRGINSCPDRKCNEGTLTMGWGSGAVELPYLVSPAEALQANFDSQSVEVTEWKQNDVSHVDSTAAKQDVCFVFISSDAGEGYIAWNGVNGDRNDLYAQNGGDKLVKEVAAACKNTIVVVHTVGPMILEEWIDLPSIKSVLIAHLPGQESGNALADIVFGDVNPSGRLPYTIAKKEEDYGPDSGIIYYPNGVVPQQDFTEGLYVDYRYFDKHNIAPRYEFGYGLSYTNFKLNSLIVNSRGVSGPLSPRPVQLQQPYLDNKLDSAKSALWPAGMRRLKKYIYPYISSESDVKKGRYPYPAGYDTPREPSPAGGGEGGNPDLYSTAVILRAQLTNVDEIRGSCVVQAYISYPPDLKDADGEPVDMPVRVLRAFEKFEVDDPKRISVQLEVTRKDLSYWDVKQQTWVLPKGEFMAHLGFSSRDLPLNSTFSTSLQLNIPGLGGN
jgi:beta-glucosidase-like glycosyl hydrolase